jgi:hypothetical protein
MLFISSKLRGAGTSAITNFIRTSISEKYDLSTKVTTRVKLPVTSQSNCVVIFVANRIGDPRNRISEKYSPRLNSERKCSGVSVSDDRRVRYQDILVSLVPSSHLKERKFGLNHA